MTPRLFYLVDELQNQLLRRLSFFGSTVASIPRSPGIAWGVGKSRDAESETRFLAHAPVQSRAASVPQNRREKIERRNIGMGDLGNVPGEREPRQLGRKFIVNFAPAELWRFYRNKDTGLSDFSGYALKKSASCWCTFSASTSPTTMKVRLFGT